MCAYGLRVTRMGRGWTRIYPNAWRCRSEGTGVNGALWRRRLSSRLRTASCTRVPRHCEHASPSTRTMASCFAVIGIVATERFPHAIAQLFSANHWFTWIAEASWMAPHPLTLGCVDFAIFR